MRARPRARAKGGNACSLAAQTKTKGIVPQKKGLSAEETKVRVLPPGVAPPTPRGFGPNFDRQPNTFHHVFPLNVGDPEIKTNTKG